MKSFVFSLSLEKSMTLFKLSWVSSPDNWRTDTFVCVCVSWWPTNSLGRSAHVLRGFKLMKWSNFTDTKYADQKFMTNNMMANTMIQWKKQHVQWKGRMFLSFVQIQEQKQVQKTMKSTVSIQCCDDWRFLTARPWQMVVKRRSFPIGRVTFQGL